MSSPQLSSHIETFLLEEKQHRPAYAWGISSFTCLTEGPASMGTPF